MFIFRAKCRRRQCPRLNPKYMKYGKNSRQEMIVVEDERDNVTIETVAENILSVNEIVMDIVESALDIVSVGISDVISNNEKPSDEDFNETSKVKKPKTFPCQVCGQIFAQFQTAIKHCATKTVTMSAICIVCGKEIKEKRNLKRHMKTHTVLKPNKKTSTKCDGCGKVFSSRQKLDYHMVKKHGVQKPKAAITEVFECTECTFSHAKERVVKAHFTNAHAKVAAKHNCDYCDFNCLTKSGMWKHLKSHKSDDIERDKVIVSDDLVGQDLVPPPHAAAAFHAPQPTADHVPLGAEGLAPPPAINHSPLVAAIQALPFYKSSLERYAAGYDVLQAQGYAAPQGQGPPPPVLGLVHHDATHLVQSQSLSVIENMDIDDFLSQNFESSNFGSFETSRLQVTEDGKELLNL